MPFAVHPATAPHNPEAILAAGGPLPSRCRSCAAPILWAVTKSGRHMPVDEYPHPDGTLRLRAGPAGLTVEVAHPRYGGARHRPHFAHCPEAKRWRRT